MKTPMPNYIHIGNLTQVLRRANNSEDPRCVFYQAVLESETVEEYLEKVGDVIVEPPTYRERMGAEREFKYMRDNRRWVEVLQITSAAKNESPSSGFRPDPEKDARQRVVKSVIQRQGQPRFRKELLHIYGGCCAITGCSVVPILEAAHITPYLGNYTNAMSNGILLRADIHSLWDLGLIAVHPETRTVCVSATVIEHDPMYKSLHGTRVREPIMTSARPSSESLNSHWIFFSDMY